MTVISRINPTTNIIETKNLFYEMIQAWDETLTCDDSHTIDELMSFDESLPAEDLLKVLFDGNDFIMTNVSNIHIDELGNISAKEFYEIEPYLDDSTIIDDTTLMLDDTYVFDDTAEFDTFFQYVLGLDVTMNDIQTIRIDPSNQNIISKLKDGIS
ncbi:MAG: hypothetical protein LLF98_01985 [Clostridium sp.]|uniref:hypothetical protein n=1 Tax=Clostridium sp. TaxID=1506 RepID=UPI0025BCDBB4|nr:hypothetical protein [Clostridium sp.]MCE5220051.1 hypothetical protein [Clostridium sp.]